MDDSSFNICWHRQPITTPIQEARVQLPRRVPFEAKHSPSRPNHLFAILAAAAREPFTIIITAFRCRLFTSSRCPRTERMAQSSSGAIVTALPTLPPAIHGHDMPRSKSFNTTITMPCRDTRQTAGSPQRGHERSRHNATPSLPSMACFSFLATLSPSRRGGGE